MDPVNKWLTTIILFMIALLIVIGWKAGSGRYELSVVPGLEGFATVYVLDTKDGEVRAQMVNEYDELTNKGIPYNRTQKVFDWPGATQYGRRY
jgi:hypothetical protein